MVATRKIALCAAVLISTAIALTASAAFANAPGGRPARFCSRLSLAVLLLITSYRDDPRPGLLDFWGLPNLQMINRDVHAAKCAIEARDRLAARSLLSEPA